VHARRLVAADVRDVACTPHVKAHSFPGVDIASLPGRVEALQAAVDAEGLRLRLHQGGELAHHDALSLSRDALEAVAPGPAGARWILLESPFAGLDDRFMEAAQRLAGLGYGLVLAHPERSAGVLGAGRGRLDALHSDGALLQVNVCSLLGRHGPRIERTAVALVRAGTAFCLASDGHPGSREDTLAAGLDRLVSLGATPAHARRLTQDNPRFLLRSGVPPLPLRERAVA
jgi:protein-tyrosine phosphatase